LDKICAGTKGANRISGAKGTRLGATRYGAARRREEGARGDGGARRFWISDFRFAERRRAIKAGRALDRGDQGPIKVNCGKLRQITVKNFPPTEMNTEMKNEKATETDALATNPQGLNMAMGRVGRTGSSRWGKRSRLLKVTKGY
jgi:hypothetical protein